MKPTTLTKFENDLIKFIRSHPYTKEQDAPVEVIKLPREDKTKIELHTVNGDYEQIQIILNYIP